MPLLAPKLVDSFNKLVDRECNDLGLLISDALDDDPLATQFERQTKEQKKDVRIQLLDSEQLTLVLQHAPEAIGYDCYILPDVFRAYDTECGFGLRIVKGLPLATAKRIVKDWSCVNELFALPKDYNGLEDALRRAKRHDAPDGSLTFERREDPKLSRFARYGPVKDCFGDGAEHLAAHIVSLNNNGYFGSPRHDYLAKVFKGQRGSVMFRPLTVGRDGDRYGVGCVGGGRSRLVVPVGAQKLL